MYYQLQVRNFLLSLLNETINCVSECLDYFQRLPYPCHGKGEVKLMRSWIRSGQCHNTSLNIEVTVGGQDPQPWKFPHLVRSFTKFSILSINLLITRRNFRCSYPVDFQKTFLHTSYIIWCSLSDVKHTQTDISNFV